MLNARADVTLGGGAKTFAETATAGEWQGKTLREQAQARGYQLRVSDTASLNSVTEANQQKPLSDCLLTAIWCVLARTESNVPR
ncbi:alkaline phosphatase [Escherichia coli]